MYFKQIAAAALLLAACAEGEYRLPYANGVEVDVTADFSSHSTPRIRATDMRAKSNLATIRAAAPGWVRYIEDSYAKNGRGEPNNYVWIEHPEPYCPVDPAKANWPGKPSNYEQTCKPCTDRKGYCNEWSFYYHMGQGTVRGTGDFEGGLSEGDWVFAGQIIGVESDVGFGGGRHLHWHVAVIDPSWVPARPGASEGGDYEKQLEESGLRRPELIPVVCHADGKTVLWRFRDYTGAPC